MWTWAFLCRSHLFLIFLIGTPRPEVVVAAISITDFAHRHAFLSITIYILSFEVWIENVSIDLCV